MPPISSTHYIIHLKSLTWECCRQDNDLLEEARREASADRRVADMAGQAALPRQSGELIFQDPWEGLAFALAVALCEQGHYSWVDFQQRLIAHIAAAEQQDSELRPTYYECWLSALEAFLVDKAILSPKKLTRRAGWPEWPCPRAHV